MFALQSKRGIAAVTAAFAFASALLASPATGATGPDLDFFESRIRPVLVEHCYECHSDARKLKGGLRLDFRDGWKQGGDSGPAIVPGDPEQSLLIEAVRWSDPELEMPPKNRLSPVQIADLERWIKIGAPDPREAPTSPHSAARPSSTNHWAYQPLKPPRSPRVDQTDQPQSSVDRFILARIERQGLKPAPAADSDVLARRLYHDLTGLPPTPDDLDAFAQAATTNRELAVTTLVDRLLASPSFGEHWGRHWLDVARFGESVTLRGFIFREAWRYRDYVIDAFNQDLPFDQFVREQIAGDLLPADELAVRQRRLIATTFLALGNTNLEEQDKKQLDMDVVDEQLDTLGKAFLAQTIGCARCHDHKFDPIPTRDYYAMAGILKNSRMLKHANVSEWLESPLPLDASKEAEFRQRDRELAELDKQIQSAREAVKALAGASGETKSASPAMVVAPSELAGIVVDSTRARPVGEWKHSTHSKRYIGDGYLHDANEAKGTKTVSFAPESIAAGRYEVRLAYIHAPSRAANVPVTVFHADGETVVPVNQQEAPVIDGRFVSLGQFRFENNGFANVLVGTEGTAGFVTADAVQFVPAESGVPAPTATSDRNPEPGSARETLKALENQLKELKSRGPRRPMVMTVREAETIEDCAVHIRGSVHNLGPAVPRGFLTVASRGPATRLPEKQSGRRELADWLTSPDNPLTARVYVNRVWCWLFGEGLVRSVDNFGTTGDAPTHPELLDHLAARFIEEGWSTKKLVRELVLTRTYQQASRPAPDLEATGPSADPENKLFARANRRRLSAEQLRDSMLTISGRINLEPPRGPTYPIERAADYGFTSNDERRSVYLPVFRNALPEIFEAFDFAPSSMVTGRRNNSTVATQALFLLNHPFVREQAELAGRRLQAADHLTIPDRITLAYRQTLGRRPTPDELATVSRHLGPSATSQTWTDLFHSLFASADFRYID